MGNFKGGGNSGGFRGGNGGGSYRRNDRNEVTMHKAVCDECHKSCEVPFRPSGDKPVYCNECFSNKRNDGDRAPRRDFNDRGPKRDFNNRPAQQPSFARPAVAQNDTAKQLGEINTKLDRLLSAIEKLNQPKIESKPAVKAVPVLATKVISKVAIKPSVKTSAKKVVLKKKK